MKTALLSVYHKEGIVNFANCLLARGFNNLIASGGTARALKKEGIPVKDVAEIIGGGSILGHRVVTVSREIAAGLLAQDNEKDRQELAYLGIPWIDLVCVDLYPLEAEITKDDCSLESVIEQTDIGGPNMIRAAAKGNRIVICDPADRDRVIEWLGMDCLNKDEFINDLAAKAEYVIAQYCLTSARYRSDGKYDGMIGEEALLCKYGENAWQAPASLFSCKTDDPLALDKFKLVAGTDPSYNNLCDIDRLTQTITHIAAVFDVNRGKVPKIAIGVKHGNACGAAIGNSATEVIEKMIEGDNKAIMGGLVILNFQVTDSVAETLAFYNLREGEKRRLLDGIIAPSFTAEAGSRFARRSNKCRLLTNPALASLDKNSLDTALRFRYVRGGFLRQPNYTYVLNLKDSELKKHNKSIKLSEEEENNLLLAWAISSTSNSNTIALTKDQQLIGNGVGQQDRVGGCVLAISRAEEANHESGGSYASSDSFFPFKDGPETLDVAGIKAILATSGSINDKEIIEYCDQNCIVLYLIPDKIGRGFFGH